MQESLLFADSILYTTLIQHDFLQYIRMTIRHIEHCLVKLVTDLDWEVEGKPTDHTI